MFWTAEEWCLLIVVLTICILIVMYAFAEWFVVPCDCDDEEEY